MESKIDYRIAQKMVESLDYHLEGGWVFLMVRYWEQQKAVKMEML
jgi:hypothetical protein